MIQISDLRDSRHQNAFALFESGAYQECLAYIQNLSSIERETSLRILEAVSLYLTGNLDEAEVCFRDLRRKVPDSAEVCLYLGSILDQRDDESAQAEYEAAVRLDPGNAEALRKYAGYLFRIGDHSSAGLFLVRLTTLSENPDDLSLLMEIYRLQGRYDQARQTYLSHGSPDSCLPEYLRILSESGGHHEIVRIVNEHYSGSDDRRIRRWYLKSLGIIHPDTAGEMWLGDLRKTSDPEFAYDYVEFLIANTLYHEAVGVWSTYLSSADDLKIRLSVINALKGLGEIGQAVAILHDILFPEAEYDPDQIRLWLSEYLSLLNEQYTQDKAYEVFLRDTRQVMHPLYQMVSAQVCEEAGMQVMARDQYNHAFRSDLCRGGIAYGGYLLRTGDIRECEKILIYVLQNVRKVRDLEIVGSFILSENDLKTRRSLLELMNRVFEQKQKILSTEGRDLYARSLSHVAERAMQNGIFGEGIRSCLKGLAIVPSSSERVAEYLYAVLMACKTQGLPFYEDIWQENSSDPDGQVNTLSRTPDDIRDLDPVEETILNYLKKHRLCHEMDLRAVAGTRRVPGLVNRLIRKAEKQGMRIVKKEGYSEFGEVYRYVGP